jgi:hypothetical protein
MFEATFKTERAWLGGPLRVVGSGDGKASRYVCEVCRRSAAGVYRVKRDAQAQDEWVCAGCQSGKAA